MRPGARAAHLAAALAAALAASAAEPLAAQAPARDTARMSFEERPATFDDLPSWAEDAHEQAFAAFRRSCAVIASGEPPVRLAVPPPPELIAVCRQALMLAPEPGRAAARAFFEARFRPAAIVPAEGRGFSTGYYEPEFDGALARDRRFATPLLGLPADLVGLPPGEAQGPLAGLVAARRLPDGALAPFFDRAAIEDGALSGRGLELVHLADPFEAFLVQVQGSARIRLPDGRVLRVAYAGRNGYPYTSIGRVLIERGLLAREDVDLPRIRAVFAADPSLAREVMRQNRSFVFFRLLENHDPALGPIGAQGVPLTPHRSIAIDRAVHAYGLPFFVAGTHPGPDGERAVARLVIAQDTGTAIVGPARIDWFAGWGAEAERLAGALRHPVTLHVLRPRPEAAP